MDGLKRLNQCFQNAMVMLMFIRGYVNTACWRAVELNRVDEAVRFALDATIRKCGACKNAQYICRTFYRYT